jgi:hypothetical protein
VARSKVIGDELACFGTAHRVTVLHFVKHLFDIRFGLISEISVDFRGFVPRSKVHDFLISGALVQPCWR